MVAGYLWTDSTLLVPLVTGVSLGYVPDNVYPLLLSEPSRCIGPLWTAASCRRVLP